MRRFFLTTLAAVFAAAGMLPANQAMAYEQEHFEMQRRIAQLEGMVADLQQSQTIRTSYNGDPAPVEEGASIGCSSCGGSGCDHCCHNVCRTCCPPAGGFFSNFELGFVQPYAANGDSPTFGTVIGAGAANGIAVPAGLGAGVGLNTPTALGTFVAPRITLGYQIPGGMGLRTRYFTFDHNNTVLTDAAGNTLGSRLRLQTWDVETFGTLVRGRNSGTMFGGYRYADFNTTSLVQAAGAGALAPGAAGSFTARQGAYGNGITGGIVGSSLIGRSGRLSINSGIRGSVLFGDLFASVVNNNTGVPVYQKTQINNMFSIWEVTLGSMYKRPLSNGSTLLIGGTIEAQLWADGGSLNPWSYAANNPAAGAAANTLNRANGSFAMLGFWNSVGLSY